MLNPISPKKVDSKISALIGYLKLVENNIHILKYRNDNKFEAEVDCCHLNVWVKIKCDGGSPVFGWKIGQDKKNDFVEAIFHAVWRSPVGEIYDVTPRENGEKRIMFVEDPNRFITLGKQKNISFIKTFDNVRVLAGKVLTPISEKLIAPQTDMIKRYSLEW